MNKKQSRIVILTIVLCGFLAACALPIVLTGSKTEAIHPDKVRLYFTRRPDCEYERVGYLSVRGGYYSQATLFRAMQLRAAKVGADGVYVQETRRLDILEYVGTAIAIRCKPERADNYSSFSSSSS